MFARTCDRGPAHFPRRHRPWRRLAGLVLLPALFGCPDPPPPGDDLVLVTCNCSDSCAAGIVFPLAGQICTDASDPDNVDQALTFLCEGKETLATPGVCKIENCGPGLTTIVPGGCPADNGEFKTGDFGQSTARAVAPSAVEVSGDDINDFVITPESFVIEATRSGPSLFFGLITGSLGTTTFTTDGLFGDDDHTLADGLLSGAPFTVELLPGGIYAIPPGTGNFIVTGRVDGERLSLTLNAVDLGGIYDEENGVFTLAGRVEAQGADLDMDVDLVLEFTNRPPRARAVVDPVVECDSTAQTAAVFLDGSDSFDLDGPEDLEHYTWYVDGAEATSGETSVADLSLGDREVVLIVADRRGSFGSDVTGVRVEDTTAPRIAIDEPRPIEYVHSDTIVLDYGADDGCTGVESLDALLDGAAGVAGHGLDDGQAIHLLTELGLGEHTLQVAARDAAGNSSQAEVTFRIVVTPESLIEAVRQFVASGDIDSPNAGHFLLGRLSAAARQYHRGNCRAAAGIYGSFVRSVQAHTGATGGHSIDPVAAEILIDDAGYLIDHCGSASLAPAP